MGGKFVFLFVFIALWLPFSVIAQQSGLVPPLRKCNDDKGQPIMLTAKAGEFGLNAYQNGMLCGWKIIGASSSDIVLLDIYFMDIQTSTDCGADSIWIFDNNFSTVGRVCGARPKLLSVSGGTAYLLFRSDKDIGGKGFALRYQTLPSACVNRPDVVRSTAVITSPNYPDTYAKNLICEWRIEAPLGNVVSLSIQEIGIQSGNGVASCPADSLSLFDGANDKGRALGVLCGKNSNLKFVSTGNVAFMRFQTDGQTEVSPGFKLLVEFKPQLAPVPAPSPLGVAVCGKSIKMDARIVGGVESVRHSWPWIAFFSYIYPKRLCGAALIHPQWIMTASHCVNNRETLTTWKVVLGMHQLSNEKEPSRQTFGTSKIFKHPNFDIVTLDNDIALVKLDRPAIINDDVMPVCLPSPSDPYTAGSTAFIAGWGQTKDTGDNDVLRETSIIIQDFNQCNKWYEKLPLTTNQICAGLPEGGRDGCQGDSGGPMMVHRKDGKWVQNGVVSWGKGCALPGFPGVYTTVTHYLDWIQKTIREN